MKPFESEPHIRAAMNALQNDLKRYIDRVKVRSIEPGEFEALCLLIDAMRENESRGVLIGVFDGERLVGVVHLPSEIDSPEDILLHITDLLQDDVIEYLGSAWPRCTLHHHPMVARMDNLKAVWVCPETGAIQTSIGELWEVDA